MKGAAENSQMGTGSSSHVEPHAHENDKAYTESAVDGISRTWKYKRQLRKGMNVKREALSSGAKGRRGLKKVALPTKSILHRI